MNGGNGRENEKDEASKGNGREETVKLMERNERNEREGRIKESGGEKWKRIEGGEERKGERKRSINGRGREGKRGK